MEVEKCTLHNKELEIICLTDRERLCPHCALFGKHKNHCFKTLLEVEEEMKERRCLFQHHLHRKDAIRERF